jgi:hypothetical protein
VRQSFLEYVGLIQALPIIEAVVNTIDRHAPPRAQCKFLGLLGVHSRYGLHAHHVAMRLSSPEASTAWLPPLLLPLPGGANQLRRGVSPSVDQRLFTAGQWLVTKVFEGPTENTLTGRRYRLSSRASVTQRHLSSRTPG